MYLLRSSLKVKRRDQGLAQIESDAELAQRLHEEELAELDRAQKERQKQEEATSAALAEEFDEIQARIDADHELAVRLTHEEQEKYTIEERARLLAEFFERRKKQLAAERAEAIRNKPPTRTQVRNRMITYLKHMGKYTHQQLKHKNFEEVQKLYEREKKWIDDFKPIDDDSQQQAESTKKRPRADSEEESSKKQKLEEDNDAEKEELRDSMDVVPRDDVAIDVESLATKYPIVDWKTHILNENMMYYQIIRADGSSKNYKIFSEMLDDFDRQDVIDLHRLVNEIYETTSLEGYDLLLWGDLKTLFEPNEEDEIWKNQQDYNLISWRLFDSCGVHVLLMNTGVAIHMMIEKKYPLTQEMLSRMLNRRLEVDYESEMAFELLRFTRSQLQNLGEDCWELKASEVTTHEDEAISYSHILCSLGLEVIVNGDAPVVASASTEGPIPPKTAEQKIARKNELKAKSTLLLAIPDEHLLKFHGIKDAKSLWEAIKTRFGGNKESKKMKKTILKQQYEKFTTSRSEGLDKIYDRFQKLISQLEIHGEVISQEDANLKLLRSLLLAWNNIALIMRNQPDLDTISMDDLYNNLKVTNEAVNTAHEVSTANSQGQASSSSYADDAMFSFFVSGHAYHESEEILKEDGKETVGFNKTKVKCYNYHGRGHFARECRAIRNQGNRNGDNARRVVPVETSSNALVVQDGIGGYDWSFKAEEGPTNFALMAHFSSGSSSLSSSDSENEASYEESIAFLKYDVQVKDISIKNLKNQLEEALKEKNDLKLKLEKFEESSKNLTKLINS
ncbi:ribonuclease H-like domain-containing protein [Tanacetum coccineum]